MLQNPEDFSVAVQALLNAQHQGIETGNIDSLHGTSLVVNSKILYV